MVLGVPILKHFRVLSFSSETRNSVGLVRLAKPVLHVFWSSLIDFISKVTHMVFCLSCMRFARFLSKNLTAISRCTVLM